MSREVYGRELAWSESAAKVLGAGVWVVGRAEGVENSCPRESGKSAANMSTPRRRRAASDRVSAVNYNKRERFYYANIGQVVAALLPPESPRLLPDEICNLMKFAICVT